MVIPIVVGVLGTGNQWKNQDHLDNNIGKIG